MLNRDMEELLKKTLKDKVKTIFVEFRDVNDMYGGIHCATQVFRKESKARLSHPFERSNGPMIRRHPQTTNRVLMVAPTAFEFNLETAVDNAFMNGSMDVSQIRSKLLGQYANLVDVLRKNGVKVSVFHHEAYHNTPDACFPNNWFSTHSDADHKDCILYPMKAQTRRSERRPDIIQYLESLGYEINSSLLPMEKSAFLEGTGSLVLNREKRIAYCLISERSHEIVAREWARKMEYELVLFHATDSNGKAIYHTNVALSVGTKFAVLCDAAIDDEKERKTVMESLENSAKKVIRITRQQMDRFCGNVLELSTQNSNSNILLMSKTAFEGFTAEQRNAIEESCKIVCADISFLETLGGGSVRCCVAELF